MVMLFQVIEHVADPVPIVRKMVSWISPRGFLVIETPHVPSADVRMFRKTYWGGYHFPRHWYLFTRHSLTRLQSESGLDIVKTQFQTGHAFWMYSLHQPNAIWPWLSPTGEVIQSSKKCTPPGRIHCV